MWNEMRGIPLFRGLTEEGLREIQGIARVRHLRRGEVLFYEGDRYEAMYVVRSGKIKLTKTTPDGKEIILYIRQDGEPIAAAMLFIEEPYPATAEAIEDCELWMIRSDEMELLIRKNADLAVQIIRLLGERLLLTQSQLRDLALQDKWGALITTLQRMIEEHGRETAEGVVIDVTLSHQELAKMIGSTREGVNRMMSQLRKANVLTAARGQITVFDPARLDAWDLQKTTGNKQARGE